MEQIQEKISEVEKTLAHNAAVAGERYSAIEQKTQSTNQKITDLEKEVANIRNIFRVIIIVALIFGIGGGFGWNALNRANTELADLHGKLTGLNTELSTLEARINDLNAGIIAQEKKSIEALIRQEALSVNRIDDESIRIFTSRLAALRIQVDGQPFFQPCNAPDGQDYVCQCPDGQVAIAVKHKDIKGDGVNFDYNTGILCVGLKNVIR